MRRYATRVHCDTYADKVKQDNLLGARRAMIQVYRTGSTTDNLDIQESKSVPCGLPASGGLAGGDFMDSGGEGYEATISPS